MKQIYRDHNFENNLNYVIKKIKYYYMQHENDAYYIKIPRTTQLDKAFEKRDWKTFEKAEEKYYQAS